MAESGGHDQLPCWTRPCVHGIQLSIWQMFSILVKKEYPKQFTLHGMNNIHFILPRAVNSLTLSRSS